MFHKTGGATGKERSPLKVFSRVFGTVSKCFCAERRLVRMVLEVDIKSDI